MLLHKFKESPKTGLKTQTKSSLPFTLHFASTNLQTFFETPNGEERMAIAVGDLGGSQFFGAKFHIYTTAFYY
jgi:hypothetical protein